MALRTFAYPGYSQRLCCAGHAPANRFERRPHRRGRQTGQWSWHGLIYEQQEGRVN
jgi:hypothetical protein